MTGFSRFGVTPETLVLTSNGHERIGTLEGQEVKIWNGLEFEDTSVFKVAENVKVLRVTADTGQELECSTDHIFMHQPGLIPDVLVPLEASELEIGMKIRKSPSFPVIETGDKIFPHAYTHGFYMGVEKYQRRRLVGSKAAVFGPRRPILEHLDLDTPSMDKNNIYFLETMPADFELPLEAGYSLETRLQWLAGLLDGGASQRKSKPKPIWYMYSESKDFFLQVKLLVETLGGDVRVAKGGDMTQAPYSLRITGPSMLKLKELKIPTVVTNIPHNEYSRRGLTNPRIASIEDDFRYSDVYNFVGTEEKMAVFNGLYTSSN